MTSSIFKITPVRNELNGTLYLLRDSRQEIVVVKPRNDESGEIVVQDWPLYDSIGPNKKLIARLRGTRAMDNLSGGRLNMYYSSNLVFVDGRFKGSTLDVKGDELVDGEWSIAGGTGEFTRAEGNIYKKTGPASNGITEVSIHAFYTPKKSP